MAAHNFLAFDLGAESGRAMVGSLSQGRLTLSEKHRFANPNGKINGHLQWNLLGQWEELRTGLRKVAAERIELAGIGVDTWGVDFGLLDRDGEPIGNPFMYRDARTAGMMEKAFARVSREKIFEATGIQFMQLNSLFQLYSMAVNRSAALERAEHLLFIPDLFHYLFTGVMKNEFSIATTSQMYDPRAKIWAAGMLRDLGIPTKILKEIVPCGTVLGPLRKEIAEEMGMGRVNVIAPATHDTASAVAAVPAEGQEWCYISSGTWSLMGIETPSPIINDKTLKYNYTNEGGVGGSIRLLKNIMGLWLVQECRREWVKEGHEHSYAELTRMAGEAKPFASVIDPDHGEFLMPGQMPQKIQEFCRGHKQVVPQSPGEIVRVCLEGLAFTYRKTVEALEDIWGRTIKVIHIVGGGCQNELLNQMTADACGKTVVAGPVEATAAGNVLTQALGVGEMKSLAEIRSVIRNSFGVKRYEPRETAEWDKAYARYRDACE